MNPLLEGIVANLVSSLIGELAGSARRRLSGDPVQNALQEAVAEALEAALEESGLSPEDCERYADSLGELFRQEKVLSELSPLLDPRPDLSLDLDRLASELKAAGLDLRGLPGFDLKAFLSRFAFAFYSAVGRQEALRDLLDLKLVGRMVNHLGSIARSSDRTADGVARIAESVEGLRRELPGFVAGSVSEGTFQGLIVGLTAAGLIPAFDAFRLIEATVHDAGYDLDIDPEGRVRIAGQPPEGRALPPARLHALEKVAVTLRHAVQAQPPSEADLDALAERYRQHVVRWFQHLTFQGMTPSARAIVLPLEEVYVELRAVAEVPEAADSFSVEERRLLLETERDPQARDELLRQLDSLRRERWSRSLPERKSIAAALYHKDQRAFVILGDPGSGKTTLLHFLALVHARGEEEASKRLEIAAAEADRLPIFVPLAAFDDMRRETPGLNLFDFLSRFYDRRRGLPGLEPLFRRALETGRALVLLDGLDEVLESGTRNYVASQAGAFIDEWSPRGVRFAVSSRFVGYREAPVPGSRPTLSVLDFGEKEIEVFVHRWARAYETWAAQEESPEAARKARELERDLLEDVRSNESVRRLAANPLMLTLLALLRRQVGRLPHRRVQLYESYVSTMLDNWLDARSQGAREAPAPAMDRHQAENILIPMALWLQREKPSGTAGLAEMERQLTDICLIEKGTTREATTLPQLRDAEKSARDFLREMREMTGLLVARGHDAFGFLHLTFQEYFAGRALALLKPDERWAVLQPHLHDPRWREPILLCAGRLGVVENRREDVTDFVRRILSSKDEIEGDLHRNLLLALAIACDEVNLDPAAVGELIETAVRCLPTNVYAFAEVLLGFLARLVADGAPGASLERCFKPAWESEGWRLRAIAVRSLGRFTDKGEIQGLLMERLQDEDESKIVRVAAMESLAGSAREPIVRRALLDQLADQSPDHYGLVAAAIRSVSGLLREDPEVCEAVIEQLGRYIKGEAVTVLSSVVREDPGIRAAVVARAKEYDNTVRGNALGILSGLVAEDTEVRALFFSMLDEEHDSLYQIAVEALSQSNDDEARRAVFAKLNDPAVRVTTFQALIPWLGTSAEIDSVILDGLRDDNSKIRSAAIQALGSRAGADETVRGFLIDSLTDPVVDVRMAALRALAPHLSWPGLQAHFVSQANSELWSVRQTVAQILGESPGVPEGLQTLIEIREKTEAPEAGQLLVAALEPLGSVPGGRDFIRTKLKNASTEVRLAAFSGLGGYRESGARSSAVLSLARAVGTYAEVRQAVLARLGDTNPHIRFSAVSSLVVAVRADAEVRQAVLDRLEYKDSDVRAAAASAVSGLLEADEDLQRTFVNLLDDELFGVRSSAVQVLLPLAASRPELWSKIDTWISSDSDTWNWEARQAQRAFASVLGPRLPEDPELKDWFLERLDDVRWSSRLGAMLTLLAWSGGPPPEIVDRIFKALEDRRGLESYPARLTAASFLINRNEDGGASINLCLEALDYGTQPWELLSRSAAIRKQAALVLGKLEPLKENQRVYDRLLRVLKEDEDSEVRDAAYNALIRLAGVRDRQAVRA